MGKQPGVEDDAARKMSTNRLDDGCKTMWKQSETEDDVAWTSSTYRLDDGREEFEVDLKGLTVIVRQSILRRTGSWMTLATDKAGSRVVEARVNREAARSEGTGFLSVFARRAALVCGAQLYLTPHLLPLLLRACIFCCCLSPLQLASSVHGWLSMWLSRSTCKSPGSPATLTIRVRSCGADYRQLVRRGTASGAEAAEQRGRYGHAQGGREASRCGAARETAGTAPAGLSPDARRSPDRLSWLRAFDACARSMQSPP